MDRGAGIAKGDTRQRLPRSHRRRGLPAGSAGHQLCTGGARAVRGPHKVLLLHVGRQLAVRAAGARRVPWRSRRGGSGGGRRVWVEPHTVGGDDGRLWAPQLAPGPAAQVNRPAADRLGARGAQRRRAAAAERGDGRPDRERIAAQSAVDRRAQRGARAEVDTSRQNGYPFRGYDAVARVRLSLGVADLPGLDADATSLTSMERLVAAAKDGTCGSYCSAATALILLRESPADRDALKLLTDLANQLRATGRTAYLAHDGSAHAQGMSVQALVARGSLLCADRSPIPLLLLQKLANYIAQGGAQWGPGVVGGGGGGGSAGVARIFALAEYDVYVGSETPDVNFTASSGPVRLLHGRFTPASREALASSTSWQALDSPPAPLVFWARGSGQINVAAGLRFVPTDPPPGPVYRGLFVEMAIRLVISGNPSGPPLRSCHLGSVALTIQVTSPDDIGSSVCVEGWLPAGWSPSTSARAAAARTAVMALTRGPQCTRAEGGPRCGGVGGGSALCGNGRRWWTR